MAAMERTSFLSRNPVTLRDMTDPAVRDAPFEVGGYLSLPEGDGERLPAIVVAEGLGGLKRSREFAYGRKLAKAGYVTLIPDSFAARGKKDAIHTWRALAVTEAQMLADAFGALHHLASHPRVDPARIGIVGFSYGGMTSVLSAYRQLQELFSSAMGAPRAFAAHASYYGCSVPRLEDPRTTGRPAMVLLGEKDRNVSVERWKGIVQDLERGGSPVDFTVFPGTYHQWDSNDREKRFVLFALADVRMRVKADHRLVDEKTGMEITGRLKRAFAIALSVSARGYHIQRDEAVCAESDRLLLEFFARGLDAPHLAPPRPAAAPPVPPWPAAAQ